MSKELAVITDEDRALIPVLSSSLYPGAQAESIGMVIAYCRAAKLDPMQKPVHIVPMWSREQGCMRDVIMPGISLYRTMASRSGAYAGCSDPEFGPTINAKIGGEDVIYPEWCRITVRRIVGSTVAEFTAREFWMENYAVKGGKEKSVAPNSMWSRRAFAQLAKCTEAAALRKAFPEFCSPPTAEEMVGRTLDTDTIIDMPVSATESLKDKLRKKQDQDAEPVPPPTITLVAFKSQLDACESEADVREIAAAGAYLPEEDKDAGREAVTAAMRKFSANKGR